MIAKAGGGVVSHGEEINKYPPNSLSTCSVPFPLSYEKQSQHLKRVIQGIA